MASPLKKLEEYLYIKEILKTITKDEEKLDKDVAEVCENVLVPLVLECKKRVKAVTKSDVSLWEKLKYIRKQFTDIYYSLKLHLVFHLGLKAAERQSKLQELGLLLELTDEELNKLPDKECAIDPGSKLLEILSDLAEHISEDSRGSEDHANIVMKMAKYWFKKLDTNNRFKPYVLAAVSHDGQCFIGSSIAVNNFLRPLYLYNRISQFKRSLQKAIIFFMPLATADSKNWKSFAFSKPDYETLKAPCQNCAEIFKNLSGFITEKFGRPTLLANCAEFCPVNQLFEDSVDGCPEMNEEMDAALRRYWNQCSILFDDFEKISDECDQAFRSEDIKRLKDVYMRVKHKVHIFGRKPECNGDLSKRHYFLRK